MKDITFRAAVAGDWAQISQLLRDNDLPLDGAEMHLNGFILAYQGQTLAGCAALERYDRAALLRSVVTRKAFRGLGLGQELVRHVLDMARSEGIRDVVLLTTTADKFFPRFGFSAVRRETAPDAVKESAEFQGACPDSAITMQLKLE
jgi:amino-acid N-acetyltransferase